MVKPRCQVNAWVSTDIMDRITKLKEEHNISRREIVERGVEALESEAGIGVAVND